MNRMNEFIVLIGQNSNWIEAIYWYVEQTHPIESQSSNA